MNTPLHIILLNGWSQSGKDTSADYLVEKYKYTKLSFAEAPKIAVSEKYKFPFEWTQTQEGKNTVISTTDDTGKTIQKTVRDLIIEYSTKEKSKTPYIFGEIIGEKIDYLYKEKGIRKIILSDWRFIEELIGVQKKCIHFTILPLHIKRPSQLHSPVADITEYSLSWNFPLTYIIKNTGSIDELYISIDTVFDSFINLKLI